MARLLSLLFALLLPAFAARSHALEAAATPTPEQAAQLEKLRATVDGLIYRTGRIALPGQVATLNLSEGFRYLDKRDAETVLTKVWGNPPGSDTLGLLVPKGVDLLADESWAVLLSFDESGYVKDSDAAKMDYPKLLREMQEATRQANPAREKEGYPPLELVGWATPPHYDAASHQLYWAKELRRLDGDGSSLNYCIRALGRRGVLQLNAVAGMDQLRQVEAATPGILSMVDFQQGHRYADFNPSTDKVAEYGLAALIAGGVLAKTGLLKGLFLALLAFKKFLVVGAVALFAGLKKFFARFSPPSQRNLEE